MRLMGEHRGIPDEERFVATRFEKVIDRLVSLPADFEPFVSVPAAAGDVSMRHSRRKSTFLEISLPPFAALKAGISILRQNPR
jgi:hypothetical protein